MHQDQYASPEWLVVTTSASEPHTLKMTDAPWLSINYPFLPKKQATLSTRILAISLTVIGQKWTPPLLVAAATGETAFTSSFSGLSPNSEVFLQDS